MNMNTLTIFWTDACITFVLFGSIECIQLFQNCSKVPFCSGAGCTMWWYIVLISYGESELHQEVFKQLCRGWVEEAFLSCGCNGLDCLDIHFQCLQKPLICLNIFHQVEKKNVWIWWKKFKKKAAQGHTALLDKHRVAFREQPLSFCSVRHLMSDIWKFSVVREDECK